MRTAVSLTFPLSIPPRWAVKEMLRMFDLLARERDDWPSRAPLDRIETGIVELLQDNPAIQLRDVYGLTALALQREKVLDHSEALACSLYAHLPQRKGLSVVTESHRFFRHEAQIVDPVFKQLELRGSHPERTDFYRVNAYPTSVAEAVLEFVAPPAPVEDVRQVRDENHAWFLQVLQRLAMRCKLQPRWWMGKDLNAIKARRAFEGYMRELVPTFAKRAPEWRTWALKSFMAIFPGITEDTAKNFILRLEDEFGGPLSPRELGKPPTRPVLKDPAASLNFNGTTPINQPPNDGMGGNHGGPPTITRFGD